LAAAQEEHEQHMGKPALAFATWHDQDPPVGLMDGTRNGKSLTKLIMFLNILSLDNISGIFPAAHGRHVVNQE
jgi:hypothetical protein